MPSTPSRPIRASFGLRRTRTPCSSSDARRAPGERQLAPLEHVAGDRAVRPAWDPAGVRPLSERAWLRVRLRDLPFSGPRVSPRPFAVSAPRSEGTRPAAQLRLSGADGPGVRALLAAARSRRLGHLRLFSHRLRGRDDATAESPRLAP